VEAALKRLSHFAEQRHTRGQGNLAEEEAVRWLEEQGLRIEARNFRSRAGEIDIVALDGETLCFIEVKARSSPQQGSALWAITLTKRRRIARAALLYLTRRGKLEVPCRFDVLTLERLDSGWNLVHFKDAFSSPLPPST
jgi:putative endonuclease